MKVLAVLVVAAAAAVFSPSAYGQRSRSVTKNQRQPPAAKPAADPFLPPFKTIGGGPTTSVDLSVGQKGTIRSTCWARIKEIVDDQNMVVNVCVGEGSVDGSLGIEHTSLAWLVMPTAGLTDGNDQIHTWTTPLKVTGTKKYGSRTIALLEVSKDEKKDALRTWTGANGKTLEAKLVGQTVTLQKPDGTEIEVPVSKLSEADRKWLREQP